MKNRGLALLLTLAVTFTSVMPGVNVQAETISENSVEEVVFMDGEAAEDEAILEMDDTAVSGNDAEEEFYGGYIPSGISYGFPENGLSDGEFAAECVSESVRRYDPRETGMVSGVRE